MILAQVVLLFSCTGVDSGSAPGLFVEECGANLDIPLNRKPARMALDLPRNRLHVLDAYSGITTYQRKSYGCDWVQDSSHQYDGFIDDLDLASNGDLFALDGSLLLVNGREDCSLQTGSFAVLPTGDRVVLGSVLSNQIWARSASGCQGQGFYFGFGSPLSVDADDDGIVVVEGVDGTHPERLASYSGSGQLEWSRPLSQSPSMEPYLCSAQRVRSNSFEIIVLDLTCKRLLAFARNGDFVAAIALDSVGIHASRVKDISLESPGVAEFLVDDLPLTLRLSYKAYVGAQTN